MSRWCGTTTISIKASGKSSGLMNPIPILTRPRWYDSMATHGDTSVQRKQKIHRKSAGHCAENCININISKGTKVKPLLPSFLVTNACHVTNKVDELQAVVETNNISVVVVTESWLNDSIPSTAINIGQSFNIFRKDRLMPGGGVLVYVHNDLPTKRLVNVEVNDKEVLWLLHTPHRTPRPFSCLITVGLYFPPGKSASEGKELNDYITDNLDNLLKEKPSAGIMITGDFNHLNPRQLCQRFGLRRIVKAPTRGQNILDQILTNMHHLYNDAQHLPPLGRSDHQCITLTPLQQRPPAKPIQRNVRMLKQENIRALGIRINLENWNAVLEEVDVDGKVEAFNRIVTDALDNCTPWRQVRMHPADKEWITPAIKIQIRARQKAFVKGNMTKYQHLRIKVADSISNAKRIFYEKKVSETRNLNPSKYFKSIYSLCGAQPRQSAALNAPTNAELQTMADQLLEAFTAPWKNREPTALLVDDLQEGHPDRPPPIPNIGQVKSILKHLNPRKATGVDGVPAWFLKRFHEELAPIVHDIICASIVQCKYPTGYKHALISPVPKVNNPTDINNDFRQISVLPQIAKVLEKIQLMLNRNDLKIQASQHAFTENRSTVTALATATQDWYNATDMGSLYDGIHVVFVDFRKAFDLVDHAILLTKLAEMGVNKSFWKWAQTYLTGRTQQVKLLGNLSKSGPVIAGVPQGGVISPTLFNIHVNDIEDCIPRDLAVATCKYADDCTQYELVSADSTSHMQDVVKHLERWAELNKMEINAKKTKDMWISFKKSCPEPERISIEGKTLERVKEFKLLGVNIQNDLKWNTHVSDIVKKANKRMYYLRVCRKADLPKDVGLTTFLTKIRPLLEYASPIWGGLPAYLEEDIERVQNRCLDVIGLPRNTVDPLALRRDISTSKEFKRFMKFSEQWCRRFLEAPIDQTHELRSSTSFRVPASRTNRHKLSFTVRGAKLNCSS